MSEDRELRAAALMRAQAALDGELDAANSLRFEADLASDTELQRSFRSARAVSAAVRRHASKETASPAMRARVLALATEEPALSKKRPPRLAPVAWAASLAALGFLAGYFVAAQNNMSPRSVATRSLIDAFARAEISGQAFDIASSDRHTVKPWLAARTTLGAEVVDLADVGFSLAGGRLDIVDGAPVSTLVYRRREHWIDVTELPPRKGALAPGDQVATVDGFHVRRWGDGNRDYVAVSDIDDSELAIFVEAFRKKVEAAAAPKTP